jgi:hypothetical protein
MSLEQTLKRVQNLIHETLPNLELFVDDNVQPGSDECDKLQMQLFRLQEQLSVFKHLKANKEVSPSFGIHAKISETIAAKNDAETEIKIISEEQHDAAPEPLQVKILAEKTATSEQKSEALKGKKMEITLNQKFQFINDLFMQNSKEYELAIDQINNCGNWEDAEIYLNSLKSIYNWKDLNENYKRLKELSKNRFA